MAVVAVATPPPATSTPIVNNSGTTTNTPSTSNSNTHAPFATTLQSSHTIYNTNELKAKTHASSMNDVKITHNGVITGETLDLTKLPAGLSTHDFAYSANATINGTNQVVKLNNFIRIYKQPNSVVLGDQFKGVSIGGQVVGKATRFQVERLNGNTTKTLPTAGKFNYSGTSFNDTTEGSFSYAIDFGAKTGQGSLTLGNKKATLDQSAITSLNIQPQERENDRSRIPYQGFGLQGNVSGDMTGRYTLGIFGDNAQEVAGHVFGSDNVGLAGSKQ